MHPKEQCPKNVCIRGLPCYIESEQITASLNEYGFTVTRAVMLKNRKTGNAIFLYMVNVLPLPECDEIYKINEIHYISITIQPIKNNQKDKQCYRCQGFSHFSEV